MTPSEFELLRPLDDEPRRPSTVDVARAIADGRRRRRTRRAAGYTGVAVVTALAVGGTSFAGGLFTNDTPRNAATRKAVPPAVTPSKPAQPTDCAIDRLPVPDREPMALVSGGDPSGRYLVGRTYPKAGGYQAVLWHDGKVRKVMLPGDMEEALPDVNSSGTAVGWSYVPADDDADSGPIPYVFQAGKVSKLPGVLRGSAYAINDAGAIVGEGNGGDSADRAMFWPSATAEAVRLPVPAGTKESSARDIDEDGTTIGYVGRRPYVWLPDGTHHELPMPTIDGEPADTATVFSIRNGWVTGFAGNGGGAVSAKIRGEKLQKGELQEGAVRWNIRTGEVRVFADLNSGANAVNAQGWQAGADEQGRAVLVADSTVVLPDLVSHLKGALANIANTVSDDGRTVGGQSDDTLGTIQAVVWHCR